MAKRKDTSTQVLTCALAFKAKVERDAPKFFKPSSQLAALFAALDTHEKDNVKKESGKGDT